MLFSFHRVLNPICFQHKFRCSAPLQQPISNPTNQDSFISENYLVKTFGFSQEKAFRSSKHLKISTNRDPELVRVFLENQGLTPEQIGSVVRFYPQILKSDPARNLLPKVEYLRSLGISQSEVNDIFVAAPEIFSRSLREQIFPTFSYIKALFESSGTSLAFTKRLGGILACPLETHLIPNVETLRDAGVPDANIVYLLQNHPRAFRADSNKFRKVVEEVKQMNMCPSQAKFIHAVIALRAMKKSTWDTKVAAYKTWGWSEDDVILAFQRNPLCMTISTDKITSFMNFLVNEMGFPSSVLLKNPGILSLSLENRVKPRCRVYKFLVENGLIKEGSYFVIMLRLTEDKFLNRFVHQYGTQAPGLLHLYQDKMDVSKR